MLVYIKPTKNTKQSLYQRLLTKSISWISILET
jgi:hypothetical protein